MRTAIGRGDGVAIGMDEAVRLVVIRAEPGGAPAHSPFDIAVAAIVLALDAAGKHLVGDGRLSIDERGEIIGKARFEMEDRFGRRVVADARGRAAPADFNPAEEIGLRARHLQKPRRPERRLRAENFRIGMELHRRAAFVVRGAGVEQFGGRMALGIALAPGLTVAENLDGQIVGERVDHGNADAVQAARGRIGLAVEFSARMEGRHDDFERRLVLELRVRVDRNPAAIVGDGEMAVLEKLDLDPARMSRDRLVHGVVQNLGEKMVQRLFVGAADIHAGALPDGFEPLKDLDILGGVVAARRKEVGFW